MITLHYEHARGQLLAAWRELAETRRLEALGRVAGGVAHDFNNMLTVMQGHLELLRMELNGAQQVASSLQVMDQAIAQAGRLTAQLLAFGRRSVLQPEHIDVREVIGETLTLLKKVIPSSIQVSYHCAEGSYAASMDRSLLEQIVLNLVTNARDAIAERGHISVQLERTDAESPGLLLCVVDDGRGMDEGVLSHIFEPFFTTKGNGKGTGLGLASVQGAVSQLGGQIHVESRPGLGTRFEVRLPLVVANAAPAPLTERVPTGPLDILIVDDAAPLREVTARLLETAGHRVRHAKDGAEALDMLRTSHCDVILSDVVMPRMGGLELAEAVAKLRPEVSIVLTSGYPKGTAVDPAAVCFLPKPFKPSVLLDTIERLTAEHRQRRGGAPQPPLASGDAPVHVA
jgi:CheY-like chemotaxis protein